MPAETTPKKIPAKRRGWLWRIGKWTLWTLLVLVVLHRPLLHFAGRRVAIWFAAREHMILDLRLGGNLWSKVEVRDVSIRADGKGPAPVERLTADRITVEYDLWKVIHSDWSHALRRVQVGTVNGLIAVQRPENADEPKTPIAEVFGELLSRSLSPVEQLSVGRVDLEVKGAVAIHGLQAEVNNRQPGYIGWEKIHLTGFPDFGPARAELVTSETTFVISKLTLLPDVVVRRLSLNHVTPTLPRGGLEVLLEAGGGTAGLKVEPSLTKDALDVSVDVDALRLNEVAAPFGVDLPAPAAIESFHAKFTGKPENLETSTADVAFVLRMEEKALFPAALVRGSAKLNNGVFRISELMASSSGVDLRIGGELNVPLADFAPSKLGGEITWKLSAPDLATLHVRDVSAMRGAVSGAGRLRLENGEAHTTGDIETMKLAQGEVQIDSATFHIDARRKIESLNDILATLTANLSFDLKGVSANGIRLDALSVTGKLDGQRVSIERFSLTSGENSFTGSARTTLKPDATGLASPPEIDVLIAAPRVEQFGVVVNGAALSGAVTADGKLRLDGTQLAGTLQATGTDLRLGETPIGGFRAQVKFEDGAVLLESLNVAIAEAGEITAKGRTTLEAPMAYSGELHVNFANLGKLDALLATAGQPAKLGGALTLDWSGDGEISTVKHSGKLKVSGKNVRHDALLLNEVRLGAAYSPEQFDTDELLVVADKTKVTGRIQWKADRLDVSDFTVSIAGQEAVKGTASIPLAPANPKGMLPLDQPLDVQLTGNNVDIAKILSSAGVTEPVSGSVSLALSAGGTLAKPDVKLSVAARSVKSPKAASVAPADVDLKLNVADARLTLDAVAKQRDIQPLTVTASLPFDVEKLREQPALLRDLPLMVAVKLPATSLAVVSRFVPAIARADGTVTANVAVSGTLAQPLVGGEASVVLRSMRLAQANLPSVSNFKTNVVFRDRTVTLRDTRGEVGGGSFNVDGAVNLTSLDRPALDLRLRSNKVLLMRDDSLTVRADTDVTVKGPLNAATAAGTVFVTQSRFLKDVDIIPLTLPGKAKPQPRSVSAPMRISFPNPPLRDWKFDIAIKTREKDSFLIRGNLAKGSSAINLRLGGTGLTPFLEGSVEIENFTALLPVSKMEVQRGFVTFSAEAPFQPQLDIQGESKIGKNTVTMNITGPASAPHLDLESEPPLPQKDILSLLATGTTTGEIGSNTSALASRAALLQVKRWYRKVFKKGVEEPAVDGQGSLMDRFDVDISNVDPKTGRPNVDASVRLTDKVYFLGELDTEGQFTGKVKYLLRFR
jgi:autotransporter translocation and assembly factor TamB